MRLKSAPRSGTAAVEFAFTSIPAFIVILGIIVGTLGVFRFQQIATLSREAARYASVHGTQYQKETGNPAATAATIYSEVIAAKAVALDMSQLSYTVTWNTSNAPYRVVTVGGSLTKVTNTVTVQITYRWLPEAFFGGMSVMTTTATTPMSF